MNEIFLTGAKGFVGKHLLRRLIEMDYHVETDMRYLHTRKYLAVIHLAAKTDISCDFNPDLIESNIILTNEIFKVNSRIIFGSSCSAAHLTNPYAYTKRYGEYLCSLHNNAIALRFFNIYGVGASRGIVKFLMEQKDGATITVRGPELVRSYIHVDDVVDVIINCITDRPKGMAINIEHLKELLPKDEITEKKLLHDFMNTPIQFAEQHPAIYFHKKLIEVGSDVGTETIDLVNLYMKLSGKSFIINVAEAGDNEPKEMIPKYPTLCLSLEEGLLKTINNG